MIGKSKKEDLLERLSAGADDYITKPIHIETLKARINTAAKIIDMENKLVLMNQLLKNHNEDIQQTYEQLDTNMQEAQRMLENTEVVVLNTKNNNQMPFLN